MWRSLVFTVALALGATLPGRKLQWTEGEVVRAAKRAWRMGYHGLAAVIAVAWD